MMTPKFTRRGYHRNGGTLLAPDLRRELGKVPGLRVVDRVGFVRCRIFLLKVIRQSSQSNQSLSALQRRHMPDRRPGAESAGVLDEDDHADATRDGTGQADRSGGLA